MNIFTQFIKKNDTRKVERSQRITQDLIRREVDATKDMFGQLPKGHRRDFFCLDKHTWIWYEEWTDQHGYRRQMTTRYLVRPKEILKSQNGGAYQRLNRDEYENFRNAAHRYYDTIRRRLYADNQQVAR